jgi:hypothetical protein
MNTADRNPGDRLQLTPPAAAPPSRPPLLPAIPDLDDLLADCPPEPPPVAEPPGGEP